MSNDSSDNESSLTSDGDDLHATSPIAGDELRTHERFEIAQTTDVAWIHGGQVTTPIRAHLTDISRGGCRLFTRKMVNPGTKGIILLQKGPDEVIIRCFEVMHCVYVSGMQHACGSRWIEMPSDVEATCRKTNQGLRLDIA